jgi:hypothetical protein
MILVKSKVKKGGVDNYGVVRLQDRYSSLYQAYFRVKTLYGSQRETFLVAY